MNTLSWILYSIDLLSKFQAVFEFSLFISTVMFGFFYVRYLYVKDKYIGYGDDHVTLREKYLKGKARFYFVLVLISSLAILVLPSKLTMQMIALSEVGEKVVLNDPVVKDSMDLIRQKIKVEIHNMKLNAGIAP